jgi:endonuclease III
MTKAQKKARTERVQKMNAVLSALYPNPKIALDHSTHWELLVAVMLSAQCTDVRVNMVTKTLFATYPRIEDYARATQREMEKAVFQCGFYRNKAKHIREAAQMLIRDFGGEVPRTMEELLMLPGVARKTTNVMLSNAFGIHEGIAVDTHVRRFAIRFNLSDYTDPVHIEKDLMEIMPQSEWWGFNHRLVHYGRDYCPARTHVCREHPLTPLYPPAEKIWPKAH